MRQSQRRHRGGVMAFWCPVRDLETLVDCLLRCKRHGNNSFPSKEQLGLLFEHASALKLQMLLRPV